MRIYVPRALSGHLRDLKKPQNSLFLGIFKVSIGLQPFGMMREQLLYV